MKVTLKTDGVDQKLRSASFGGVRLLVLVFVPLDRVIPSTWN